MSSNCPSQKLFTVAIVGGGIGGLTLAVGLLRRKIPVQIYEAAQAFKEIGLGLSIAPAAHRAMPLIDPQIREIYDSLITTHADSPGYEHFRETFFEIVWATGEKNGDVLLNLKAFPSGQTTARRADFLDALVRLVPQEITHFKKRLVGLVETATGVNLAFEDGTSAVADVVIGCDGIRSKVKQYVVPEGNEQARPRFSGMYAYRGILDMETMVNAVGDDRARVATVYIGQNAYVISYPIMHAQRVNVGLYRLSATWGSKKWVVPADKAEMLQDFDHMGQYVKAIITHILESSKWAVFEHPPISTYAKSRVAILGDAAHASTPHQGAGAGQAIEDAHVLSELLGDARVTRAEHVTTAFQAYDAVRRPRSQHAVESSKEMAQLMCLRLDGVKDNAESLKENFQERFGRLWNIDIAEQAQKTRQIMAELMQKCGLTNDSVHEGGPLSNL